MVVKIAYFALNISEKSKHLNMQYIKQGEIVTEECVYNLEKSCWEVNIEDLNINTLYYFQKNDNFFLDPSNTIIKKDGNMYYSVYTGKNKPREEKIMIMVVINNKMIANDILPTIFLDDFSLSLKLDMIFNLAKQTKSHIITIEWISPEETYYIMDNLLEVKSGETKISVNPHLRIDPSTMKSGVWNIRILIDNFLVKDIKFNLSSITYSIKG